LAIVISCPTRASGMTIIKSTPKQKKMEIHVKLLMLTVLNL